MAALPIKLYKIFANAWNFCLAANVFSFNMILDTYYYPLTILEMGNPDMNHDRYAK